MRSFTIVLLLALAVAIAAFAPVASAGANITLYADQACSQSISEPLEIPLKSSPSCVDLSSPTQTASAIFQCSNSVGFTNMSLAIWQSVADCSGGAADASIFSVGKTGGCVVVTIVSNGQTVPAFGNIACDSSISKAPSSLVVEDTMRAIQIATVAPKPTMTTRRNRMLPRKQTPQ